MNITLPTNKAKDSFHFSNSFITLVTTTYYRLLFIFHEVNSMDSFADLFNFISELTLNLGIDKMPNIVFPRQGWLTLITLVSFVFIPIIVTFQTLDTLGQDYPSYCEALDKKAGTDLDGCLYYGLDVEIGPVKWVTKDMYPFDNCSILHPMDFIMNTNIMGYYIDNGFGRGIVIHNFCGNLLKQVRDMYFHYMAMNPECGYTIPHFVYNQPGYNITWQHIILLSVVHNIEWIKWLNNGCDPWNQATVVFDQWLHWTFIFGLAFSAFIVILHTIALCRKKPSVANADTELPDRV
jgi:hypothetical protein